jgi:hypothetical protein
LYLFVFGKRVYGNGKDCVKRDDSRKSVSPDVGSGRSLAGNFDGNGNLSANIVNTATNLQEFYILKVQ